MQAPHQPSLTSLEVPDGFFIFKDYKNCGALWEVLSGVDRDDPKTNLASWLRNVQSNRHRGSKKAKAIFDGPALEDGASVDLSQPMVQITGLISVRVVLLYSSEWFISMTHPYKPTR